MSERAIVEYAVNSLWQVPLLAAATWLLVRIARPTLWMQHLLWLGALGVAVLLPLRGVNAGPAATIFAQPSPAVMAVDYSGSTGLVPIDGDADPVPDDPSPRMASFFARVASLSTLRTRAVGLSPTAIRWSVWIYVAMLSLSAARLVRSWIGAQRLLAEAFDHPLTTLETTLLRACARRLGLPCDRIPALRFIAGAGASPMVIGFRRPVLLMPEFLRHRNTSDFDDEALAAIFSHELAHIRRNDYLVNVVAHLVALPIAWHPATQVLHARIRQTREMICDGHAAGSLDAAAYARALISLAARLIHIEAQPAQPASVGLFEHTRNTLEERIMKLVEPKLSTGCPRRLARIAAGTVVLTAATCTAATFHLKASALAPLAVVQAQSVVQAQAVLPAQPGPAPASPVAPPPVAPPPMALESVPPVVPVIPVHVEEHALPQLPAQPLAQVPTPAPGPATAPEPPAAPQTVEPLPAESAAPAQEVERPGRIIIDGQARAMTATEREQFDRQMKAMHEQIAAATMKFHDPEFQRQLREGFKPFDSAEFRKQMQQMQQTLHSPEFKKQMQDAQRTAQAAALNSPEIKHQMEQLRLQLKSPEFRRQIDDAQHVVVLEGPALQHSLAESRRQLDEASKAIAEARRQTHDDNVQRQLDEAQRRIDKAAKME